MSKPDNQIERIIVVFAVLMLLCTGLAAAVMCDQVHSTMREEVPEVHR